jgi:hypothetical protein
MSLISAGSISLDSTFKLAAEWANILKQKKLGRYRGQSSYNNIQYQKDEKNAGKETYGEGKAKRGIVYCFSWHGHQCFDSLQ